MPRFAYRTPFRRFATLLPALFTALLVMQAPVQAQEVVRIGVLAKRGELVTLQRWAPTADYLSERVAGHRFVVVPLDFDVMLAAVAAEEVDFALANSSFYVEMERRFGASRIATLRNRTAEGFTTRFGGVIFTRADNAAVREMVDLVGKPFMAVDATSLGGFHAAWRELKGAGIDPYQDFAPLLFGGTHDAVVTAVREGRVAAGTVRSDTLERMAAEGTIDLDGFRVVAPKQYPDFPYRVSTRLYPEWPFAKMAHSDAELAHQVANALLAMPADSEAARAGQVAGWTFPRNYQPVHDLMRDLRIGPYADLGRVHWRDVLRQYWYWVLLALAALAALSLVNSYVTHLNQRLRRSEEQLREARDGLAIRVRERTADLEHALEEVKASRRRIDLIRQDWNDAFDAITDPIFIHDAELRIVHANPAYVERAGMPAEALEGRRYWEVFPPLEGPLEACRETPERLHPAEEVMLPGGEVFLSRSFGVVDAEGTMQRAVHILKDVTAERRAEAHRRELARALEQSAEGVLVLDPACNVLHVNRAAARLLGREPAALQGTPAGEMLPAELLRPLAGKGEGLPWTGPAELATVDGALPVVASLGDIAADGRRTGFVVNLTDMRAVRAAEAALRYRIGFETVVAEIAARFVLVDPDHLEEAVQQALQRLGRFVDCDRAYLAELESDRVQFVHEWVGDGVTAQEERLTGMPLARFEWSAARLRGGSPVVVEDVAAMEDAAAREREFLRAGGVRSIVVVPLLAGERLDGFMALEDVHEPRHWSGEDLALLKTVGEVVAGALRRLHAEQAVRRSEAFLAEAQGIARLGNWEWDIGTGRLRWSDEIYRIFGVEPRQFGATYQAFLSYVHPNDRQAVTDAVDRAVRERASYAIDHRVIRADGQERVVHERGRVSYADGEPVRMVGTVQDVTDARRTERELARLNRALRTLSRGNGVLVHAEQEQQLLDDVCRVLVETGGYRFAWVGYAEQDGTHRVRPVARDGHEAGYLDTTTFTWGDDRHGQGPTGRAIREGRVVVARDIGSDEHFAPWREAALQRGYASVAAFPLRDEGRAFGALTIDAAEVDAFDANELKLLTELADDLAFGIRTLRAGEQRRRAERALKESEERYHTLYEAAPNGYASVNAADGSLLQFNEKLAQMLGYPREELAQMKVLELYADTPDGLPRARAVLERFRHGEVVRDCELQMCTRGGEPLWVSLSVEPVLDADGQVRESRSSVIDISARKQAEAERRAMAGRLQRSLLQTIQAIAVTIEKRDPYTAGHQQRVSELAVAIAREMGLAEERSEGLRLAALIHDIGKIYVPTEILNRPGKLDPVQYQLLRTHPSVGYDIVKGIEFPWPLADMVLQHHERCDGSGYPKGLKREEILLESRILTVADVVEAMASHRPYRPAHGVESALDEIGEHAGEWFDPEVVEACVRLFREGRFAWKDLAA